jgi:DNA polymerase-1
MPDLAANPTTAAPPTLYIIDGYAQFFRAYHAIRTPMSSPVTKEPTNMTFGFLGMLLRLLRGQGKIGEGGGRADYVLVALDVSGDRGTFRSQIYPEYKAHRPPAPEDLGVQVERCLKTLERVGVPVIGAEGYEADDVIATLVARARAQRPDLRVRIISKDKDLKQLLSDGPPGVELFDIHNEEVISEAGLKAETGLSPRQVIDYLALMGDSVDNVPGVEGVGPKTAAQLIAEYGSLEAVVAEAMKPDSRIKGKRLENIRAAAGMLDLSRRLVTLHSDLPVELDLAAAETRRLRLEELLPVLKELGFNRFQDEVRELTGAGGGAVPAGRDSPSSGVKVVSVAGPARRKEAGGGLFTPGLFDAPHEADARRTGAVVAQSGEYRAVTSEKELRELVEELREAECVALDTETTGLYPLRDALAGVCLSTKVGTGVYVPVRSPTPKDHLDEATVLGALRPVLEDPLKPKCGHNLKFDVLVLRRAGVRVAGFTTGALTRECASLGPAVAGRLPCATAFDSMVASYLIDAERSSHGLDALALALLGRTNISIKELIGSGKDQVSFDRVPLERATPYAAEDADVALQLREIMRPQLAAMGLEPLFAHVEMPLVEVLAELEWNGIRVDKAELERQRERLAGRIEALRREIVEHAETTLGRAFNPDSPRQLAGVLFNKPDHATEPGYGIKPVKKIKTGYSTDAEVLETLAEDATLGNPIPRLIVEHRELSKLVNTYLEALSEEVYDAADPRVPEGLGGRIHCSFNQTVAATGRLASSDPNLQNIPIRTDVGREIRRAFVAAPGNVLVSADYSQIELRLLAHLSRDDALIAAFRGGQDIHTAVAAEIHGIELAAVSKAQRSGAKMVNFGIVYGVTPFGLARRLGVSTAEADGIITGYKKRFAGITTFLQECVDQAARMGFVRTMLGRRRPIPDIGSSNPSRRGFAERTAINSVVQGSAADLIKLAMVELQAAIRGDAGPLGRSRMLLQIHDELVLECPREDAAGVAARVKEIMEGAMRLSVPLVVDARWAESWIDGK